MPYAIDREELRHKANLYKILAVLYNPPSPEAEAYLDRLEESLAALMPQLAEEGRQMADWYRDNTADLTAMQVEHARLFVGPFDLLAPPFSSVYLDGARTIMGEATVEAFSHYTAAGLDVSDRFKAPPDHITAELEFMYYLNCQYLNTGDDAVVDSQRRFLSEHLGRWVGLFAARLQERAESVFYRSLGRITGGFVAWDQARTDGYIKK